MPLGSSNSASGLSAGVLVLDCSVVFCIDTDLPARPNGSATTSDAYPAGSAHHHPGGTPRRAGDLLLTEDTDEAEAR
jgi:hypothetical protein